MNTQQEHKLLRSIEDIAKAVKRIADVVETPAEPLIAELDSFAAPMVLSWQDAVRVLKDTCKEAEDCDRGCPMYKWCQANYILSAAAPMEWTDPGAGE